MSKYSNESKSEELQSCLSLDALAEAEAATGRSYKKDETTRSLGLLFFLSNNRRTNDLLQDLDDTMFSDSLVRYTRIIESEGFYKILEMPFISLNKVKDKLFCYFHEGLGIFLKFDTYGGLKINSSDLYYNWKPNSHKDPQMYKAVSSGGFSRKTESLIWVGYSDGREAIRHKLHLLRQHGSFVTPWIENSYMNLCHWGDYEQARARSTAGFHFIRSVSRDRYSYLPEKVRSIIGDIRD